MAEAPPPAKPAAPSSGPQRAIKKAAAARIVKKKAAAAAAGPSAAQLTLYHVLPRAAPGAPSGGQALLRAEEDRRRYEEQVRHAEADAPPAERDLRRETTEETRASRARDARAVADAEARAQAERDAAGAHARPSSAALPVIAFNPYATNVPPLALTHVEDERTTSRQERIWKEVPESRWRWPLNEERRISFQELLYREHYLFCQCEYLRDKWQKVLAWQGNYGRLYKLLTHPIASAYRAQEMADMEAACAAAQISRRFKPSRANPVGKIVYARPKDKFYTSTVKSIEGTFYSHLDQMNQIGDCDMFLLTIIPRPGIANASLAAAWLEVPRELSVIYEALKSWRGLVRFVLTVDVHPGPGKQRSKVKPAAGEMNGAPPPRPRDDMDGVHEAHVRPSAKPKAAAAKQSAAASASEGPAPGALAKPSGSGPRKPAPKRRREQLRQQRALARGEPTDEREATAGVGRADAEAEAPSGDEDEAAAVREREARVRATGLSVAESAPAQLPAARAYAARIQADLAALQQSRMSSAAAGDRPVAPRAGWFVGDNGAVVTLDSRNRGGGAGGGGLKGGARRLGGSGGGEDEVMLHEQQEEEGEGEPAGEAINPDESISEDDPEELAAEEELMQEARPEELEDASDVEVPVAERVHLEEQYAAAERQLATLLYLVPSRPDVHAKAREDLDAARRALEQRGLRVPGSEREERVEADDGEGEEEDEGVNAHDAAYLEARKRAKLDNADQSKLLKWHPHYHVSVTFTKMSGVAAPDLGALKAELQNRGLKDVNIKRSYKPGINNWNKIERYPLVTANDPLVHRFLLAVGHERVSVDGVDVGPEYEYPERLEANVLHHRMRSALEYTNRDVLSHVPDYYKRLENYYYALRTASTNASGDREIPSLSDYFDNARAHDLNALEAISQPLAERTSFVKQLQDLMRRENLKVKRVGKGEKDFAVYAPVTFKPPGERQPISLSTAHELLCPNLDAFQGYIINRGLRELDSHFSRTGQGIWKAFAPLVTGAINAADAVGEDEEDCDAAVESRPAQTVLPTFFKSKRWLAFGEGWFFLCDDPHNPDTPKARLRLRYLRKYCCAHGRNTKCLHCTFYVNLPVWFPLPMLKTRPATVGDLGGVPQTVNWPSPFLYRWASYRDHMARSLDTDGVRIEDLPERSQEALVVERLCGASCYFVSKTFGKMYTMDRPDTPQGDAAWAGPRNWLRTFERYWKPPCTHNWKRLPDTDERKNHWRCEAVHRRGPGDEHGEICGDVMPGRVEHGVEKRPAEALRKSWGLEATLATLDVRRQAYQRFVNAQLVLVVWGDTRTGKTAFIVDLGPDGGCFQKDDIFMVGKGEADVFGRLRDNTVIAWLNEYHEWKMKAVDFKAFAEGSSMNARGMYESGSITSARFFKCISMNGVKVDKRVPLTDPNTGEQLVDAQGVPQTRVVTYMRRPFGRKYDKDGAVGARLHMAEMSIHPPTQDQELSMRIAKYEWDEILVYQMTLKYVPLERRAAWRQKRHTNISREERREDEDDAGGSQLPPPPPPPPQKQPPLVTPRSSLITVAAPGQGSGDEGGEEEEEEEEEEEGGSTSRSAPPSSRPLPPQGEQRRRRVRLNTSSSGILGAEDTVMFPGEEEEEEQRRTRKAGGKRKQPEEEREEAADESSSSGDSLVPLSGSAMLDREESVTRLGGSTSLAAEEAGDAAGDS